VTSVVAEAKQITTTPTTGTPALPTNSDLTIYNNNSGNISTIDAFGAVRQLTSPPPNQVQTKFLIGSTGSTGTLNDLNFQLPADGLYRITFQYSISQPVNADTKVDFLLYYYNAGNIVGTARWHHTVLAQNGFASSTSTVVALTQGSLTFDVQTLNLGYIQGAAGDRRHTFATVEKLENYSVATTW